MKYLDHLTYTRKLGIGKIIEPQTYKGLIFLEVCLQSIRKGVSKDVMSNVQSVNTVTAIILVIAPNFLCDLLFSMMLNIS